MMAADHAEGNKSEISDQYIQKTNNERVRVFTYDELVSATNRCNDTQFSTYFLEENYKGWVDEVTYAPTEPGVGLAMFVRTRHMGLSMLFPLDFDSEEFNHPNLAKLLGYCLNDVKMSCVYELSPGLDKLLYGARLTTSLSWVARLKIAVGAAHGLSYFHKKGHPAYTQLKTTYIMVDADYNARLRDFKVDSSFFDRDSYTFGDDAYYSAPEWFRYQEVKFDCEYLDSYSHREDANFGVKSEIYSFGVVLLEILTGMKVFDLKRPQEKQNLAIWAAPLIANEANLGMILDPKLLDNNHPPKGAYKMTQLVSTCLQREQDKRPSMENILSVLRECYIEQLESEETNDAGSSG